MCTFLTTITCCFLILSSHLYRSLYIATVCHASFFLVSKYLIPELARFSPQEGRVIRKDALKGRICVYIIEKKAWFSMWCVKSDEMRFLVITYLLSYLFTYLLTYFLTYILIYLLTYSIVQSPSWETNWFAASQGIPRISRNSKVHYRTHKRPPPVSILDQPNPVHIPTSHLLQIHPNIIHPSTPRSSQWFLSLRFPHQDPIRPLSSPIRATWPAHLR